MRECKQCAPDGGWASCQWSQWVQWPLLASGNATLYGWPAGIIWAAAHHAILQRLLHSLTSLLAPPPSRRSYCAGNYKPELPAMEELEPGTFYLVRAECSLVMQPPCLHRALLSSHAPLTVPHQPLATIGSFIPHFHSATPATPSHRPASPRPLFVCAGGGGCALPPHLRPQAGSGVSRSLAIAAPGQAPANRWRLSPDYSSLGSQD